MNFETYTEFLQVPRLLSVQLQAPGATGEQLEQHPARLSREGRETSDTWSVIGETLESKDGHMARLSAYDLTCKSRVFIRSSNSGALADGTLLAGRVLPTQIMHYHKIQRHFNVTSTLTLTSRLRCNH